MRVCIRESNTETQRRLREEAEIEIMLPRARKHLEQQEAERGKEGASPTALAPGFRLLAFRAVV